VTAQAHSSPKTPYEEIRTAEIDDVVGLIELLRPLEEEGILVRRSRERLETEINRFAVIERDGMIVGCAALVPFTCGRQRYIKWRNRLRGSAS
jgi:N-acetylglutamate synthase-like GNAT family acetyltransferase